MTRQTARGVDDALSGTDAPASTDRRDTLRTNAVAALPQRAPRFPDTPWGRLRGTRGWSLRELSRRSGVNTAELSRMESRGIGPTPDQAWALMEAYAYRPEPAPESATDPGPQLTAYARDYAAIRDRGDVP